MTDRIKGFTVVLDQDIREDDVQSLRQAILQFAKVLEVVPVKTTIGDFIERSRIRREFLHKFKVLLDENVDYG